MDKRDAFEKWWEEQPPAILNAYDNRPHLMAQEYSRAAFEAGVQSQEADVEQIERLSNRWSGFSLEKRFDWVKPWRAKIIPNKQERQDYRLTEYGDSPYEALTALEESVKEVDQANEI